ncbi:MAG: methionine synthase [Huintestinicola sp.]
MNKYDITIDGIDRQEALRYMCCTDESSIGSTAARYIDECEKRMTDVIAPKCTYRYFSIAEFRDDNSGKAVILEGCSLALTGEDIYKHLNGCSGAVILCATIGAAADKLIRIMQVEDMAKAVIADALASSAVESVCNKAEEHIRAEFPDKWLTWRYSPGYGDLPIDMQKQLLAVIDAPKKIGVCTGESHMLTPIKSVTAIMGVSDNEVPKSKRSCTVCNMRELCRFRKRGLHCEL